MATKKPSTSVKKTSKTTSTEKVKAAPKKPSTTTKKASTSSTKSSSSKHRTPKATEVIIHYNVGYPNKVYLRGEGPGLSWHKGVELENVGHDCWRWSTTAKFAECEFKVLVNDCHYEHGENQKLHCGCCVEYTPQF